MGFVKTKDEMAQYYKLAIRQFPGAKMIGILYQTDPQIIERLLPPPLEPADEAWALSYIAEFPDTNLGPGYKEGALFIRCQYKGEIGNYCLSMPLEAPEDRMLNGRDIYGFPKKLAKVHFEQADGRTEGRIERHGICFAKLSVQPLTQLPEPPLKAGPNFLFKAMPAANLQPGFDGPVHIVRQQSDLEYVKFEMGMGEITLEPSVHDPWHEVKCVQVLSAYLITANMTMQPGEVVGEADPEKVLPYYFARTDWGFAK